VGRKEDYRKEKTPGWWVLRYQQWSGVPTLVKGEKGRVVWFCNGLLFVRNVLLSSNLVRVFVLFLVNFKVKG